MNYGVMITDGGPHPPELWAEVTADRIIDISATAPEAKLIEARAFRAKLVDILTHAHNAVQQHERGKLEQHGNERLLHDYDDHTEDHWKEIVEAAKGLSFESHFQQLEVQGYLRQLLHEHFTTACHIERSWHADANPDSEQAQAFRAAHHPLSEA